MSRREHVEAEILDSERSYVRDIQALVDLYVEPLKASLATDEHAQLFSIIETLLAVNLQLLDGIEAAKRADPVCYGALFERMGPQLERYSDYVDNFSSASTLLRELRGEATFQSYFDGVLAHERSRGQPLESFLIMPVQRIPRYKLLLSELLKHTPASHPDHGAIGRAIRVISDAATHINEAIRSRENEERLRAIGEKEKVDLIEPARVVLREGVLRKVCRKGPKDFDFYLFSDMLMYCGDGAFGGRTSRQIDLRTKVNVEVKPWTELGEAVTDAFLLGSSSKSFWVLGTAGESAADWASAIREVSAELTGEAPADGGKEEEAAPVWESDVAAKQCARCSTDFNMFTRKHHCRNCGGVVCNACSQNKFSLPHIDAKKLVRVCKQCYSELMQKRKYGTKQIPEPAKRRTKTDAPKARSATISGRSPSVPSRPSVPERPKSSAVPTIPKRSSLTATPALPARGGTRSSAPPAPAKEEIPRPADLRDGWTPVRRGGTVMYQNDETKEVRNDAPPALLPDWDEAQADDGEYYYFNTITQETTWDIPLLKKKKAAPPPPPPKKPAAATASAEATTGVAAAAAAAAARRSEAAAQQTTPAVAAPRPATGARSFASELESRAGGRREASSSRAPTASERPAAASSSRASAIAAQLEGKLGGRSAAQAPAPAARPQSSSRASAIAAQLEGKVGSTRTSAESGRPTPAARLAPSRSSRSAPVPARSNPSGSSATSSPGGVGSRVAALSAKFGDASGSSPGSTATASKSVASRAAAFGGKTSAAPASLDRKATSAVGRRVLAQHISGSSAGATPTNAAKKGPSVVVRHQVSKPSTGLKVSVRHEGSSSVKPAGPKVVVRHQAGGSGRVAQSAVKVSAAPAPASAASGPRDGACGDFQPNVFDKRRCRECGKSVDKH